MSTGLIVFLLVLVGLIIYLISIYNTLVQLRNQFQNSFAQIEVQLKRRYDLIPNLVETAKGAMAHERETLEAVTLARNEAMSVLNQAMKLPGGASQMDQLMGQLSQAENSLQHALSNFSLKMEAYPDLKTSQNMLDLSEELSTTENRIAFARQAFNDSVMSYNTYRQSFPPIVFAGLFGHALDAQLLEFDDSEAIKAAPKVSF